MAFFFMEFEKLTGKLLTLWKNFIGENIMMRLDSIDELVTFDFRHGIFKTTELTNYIKAKYSEL